MRKKHTIFLLIFSIIFLNLLSGCSMINLLTPKDINDTKETTEDDNNNIKKEKIYNHENDINIISYKLDGNYININYKINKSFYKQVIFFVQTYKNNSVQETIVMDQINVSLSINHIRVRLNNYNIDEHIDVIAVGYENEIKFKLNNNYKYGLIYIKNDIKEVVKITNNKLPYLLFPTNEYTLIKGYYYDHSYKYKINHDDIINKHIIAFAKTALDLSVINKINVEIMKSNVTIISTFHKKISQGSGGVVQESANGYYILTNSHVVNNGIAKPYNIEVINYLQQKKIAKLLYDEPSYDIAILFVKKNVYDNNPFLRPLKIANIDSLIGDNVIAIGQPNGQINTVTSGVITDYKKVKLSDGISPNFKVIWHDAPIDHGSSGGILLNSNLEICGINFAGKTSLSSKEQSNCAIPVSRIIEVINNYNNSFS